MAALRQLKASIIWRDYEDSVVQAALTPDGTKAITASIDGMSYIHYVQGTGCASTKAGVHGSGGHGHDGAVNGVAISSDGTIAASAGLDNRVRVWDTATAAQIASFRTSSKSCPADVVMARDCRIIAAAFTDHTRFDARKQATIAIFELEGENSSAKSRNLASWTVTASRRVRLAISSDGSLVASTVSGGVNVVEVATKKIIAAWKTTGDASIAIDNTCSKIAIADSRSLRVCAIAGSKKSTVFQHYKSAIEPAVAFGAGGMRVVAAIRGGAVRLYDGALGSPVIDLCGPSDDVSALSMSIDGSYVLGSSMDKKSYVWRLNPVPQDSKVLVPSLSIAQKLVAIEAFQSRVDSLGRNDSLLHVQAKVVLESLVSPENLKLLSNRYAIAEVIDRVDDKGSGSVDQEHFLLCVQELNNSIEKARTPSSEEILQQEFVNAAGHLELVITVPVAAAMIEKRVYRSNNEIRAALCENSNGLCVSYDELMQTLDDLS